MGVIVRERPWEARTLPVWRAPLLVACPSGPARAETLRIQSSTCSARRSSRWSIVSSVGLEECFNAYASVVPSNGRSEESMASSLKSMSRIMVMEDVQIRAKWA